MSRTIHLLVAIDLDDGDDRTVEQARADVERRLGADPAGVILLTHPHDDNAAAAPRSVDPARRHRAEDAARERAAYLAAVIRALLRRDQALQPYLSPVCPECGQVPGQDDGDHVVLGAAVVIGCEGYRVINPNVVGIPSPNWQPQD
jgi:hypothetical protein